jgi:hypothetical protein
MFNIENVRHFCGPLLHATIISLFYTSGRLRREPSLGRVQYDCYDDGNDYSSVHLCALTGRLDLEIPAEMYEVKPVDAE